MPVPPDLKAELTKAWRLGTAPLRRLPDFVLPGAPKCGTSSLYDALVRHPQARRAASKEPTNFIHYPTSSLRSRMHYPFAFGDFVTGEASVEYFIHPDAPRSIRDVVPQAKLIFLFRDPVERAYSDYRMFCRSGHEKESFATVVEREMRWHADPSLAPLIASAARNSYSPVRYLLNGLYAQVLENWLSVFPREQCLFLISDDFFCDERCALQRVYTFLGLAPHEERDIAHARAGGSSEPMDPKLKERLQAFFEPHNRALERLLQVSVPW